jgi:hypothetical protein
MMMAAAAAMLAAIAGAMMTAAGGRLTGVGLLQCCGLMLWGVIKGDGNCGFTALAMAIDPSLDEHGAREQGIKLRKAARDQLAADRARPPESRRYHVPARRIKHLRRKPDPSDDRTWAGEDTLAALVDKLGEVVILLVVDHHGGRRAAFGTAPVEKHDVRVYTPHGGARPGADVRHLLLVQTVRRQCVPALF